MAKLNDEAVVQYYQQKKQALTDELQKIDTVLNALNGQSAAPAPKKRKYTRRAPVAAQTTAQTTATKAPRAPKAAAPGRKSPAAAKPRQASQGAKPNTGGTWDDKIQSALIKIGTADKDSLVQHIAAKDPASPEKVRKALTLRLAVMEKNGKLQKNQSGDTPQYRLP